MARMLSVREQDLEPLVELLLEGLKGTGREEGGMRRIEKSKRKEKKVGVV